MSAPTEEKPIDLKIPLPQDGDPFRRSPDVLRLRRADRRAPGDAGHRRAGRDRERHRLPRGFHLPVPVHGVAGTVDAQRLRERRGHGLGHRDHVPVAPEAGQAQEEHEVHRLRRRRRHLRHRVPGPFRRHGARPSAALHLLRQRRLHEHRHPAFERHALRRGHDDLPRRLQGPGQAPAQEGPDPHHGRP